MHTTNRREFTEDEVHFLLAIATVLAMAVVRNQTQAELQKLAAFVRLHPNPAMELDAEARITYANEAARKLATRSGAATPAACCPRTSRNWSEPAWPRGPASCGMRLGLAGAR